MTNPSQLPRNIVIARAIAFGIAFIVGAINLLLSFFTLRNLALRSSIPIELVWMWPVGIDGTILVATLGVVAIGNDPARRGDRRYFWTLLVGSATVSIGFNIGHAILPVDGPLPTPLNAVIAATAPICVLLTTHALVVLGRPTPASLPSDVVGSTNESSTIERHDPPSTTHHRDTNDPAVQAINAVRELEADASMSEHDHRRWHDMADAVIRRASMHTHDLNVVAQALHLSYDKAWPQRQVGDELKMSHNTVGKIVNTCAQLMREGEVVVAKAS